MSEVKKKSGFKEFNDVFWCKELKSGTKYQCKVCGKTSQRAIGYIWGSKSFAGDATMHEPGCKYGDDQGNEPAAAKLDAAIDAPVFDLKWEDTLNGISRIRLGKFVLTVHRIFGYEEQWFASCHHGPFSQVPLGAADLESAKAEAVGIFKDMLNNAAKDLGMELK